MAASSAPLSSPFALSLFLSPKPPHFISSRGSFSSLLHIPSSPAVQSTYSPRKRSNCLKLPNSSLSEPTKSWRLSANLGNYLLSEASPIESSQEIVSATDDGVSTIVSALFFLAFVGLSILSIGVIYIAVTDFLQKREREKFEKEEAAKKKKGKKKEKVRARARAGPRGFGQKIEEDAELDETD